MSNNIFAAAFGSDNVNISLDALKRAEPGDMVVVIDDNGSTGVFSVELRQGTRGAAGGTRSILRNVVTGEGLDITVSTALPAGVAVIRRVTKGVNARTLRKAASEAVSAVAAPVAEEQNAEAFKAIDDLLASPLVAGECSLESSSKREESSPVSFLMAVDDSADDLLGAILADSI